MLKNINASIEINKEYVGSLNLKGELYCKTNLIVQNGNITNRKYNPVKKVTKTAQKLAAKKISKYIVICASFSNDKTIKISRSLNCKIF